MISVNVKNYSYICTLTNNRKSAAKNFKMNNNQLQVVLTGIVGDGCLYKANKNGNYSYHTSSINKEYIEYKKNLLGSLCTSKIYEIYNSKGSFKTSKPIYRIDSLKESSITNIAESTLKENLEKLDDLGLALWIYDDGSLHKTKLFYNINTQKYSYKEHKEILEPYFKSKGIIAKTTKETKKDGKVYYYLRVSKYEGAYEISCILRKYYCKCYEYKIWSSETIQQWSKFQEELKSKGTLSNVQKGKILVKYKI